MKNRGLTVIEIIIVIVIITIIAAIGTTAFIVARKSNELNVLTDQVASSLEQAKSDAQAGKYSRGAGVRFSTTTYILFSGNVYVASTSDKTYNVTANYQVTASSTDIIFARLTGYPSASSTVTIVNTTEPSKYRQVTVGPYGDIRVVK